MDSLIDLHFERQTGFANERNPQNSWSVVVFVPAVVVIFGAEALFTKPIAVLSIPPPPRKKGTTTTQEYANISVDEFNNFIMTHFSINLIFNNDMN